MRKIKLALLGQGRSGHLIHGAYLQRNRELFEVAAVVDALPERREKARALYGCKTYATWQEVLQDGEVELCVNALFSNDHYPATLALLRAGKHVLVEKPIAKTPEQVDIMAETARESNRTLAFFQQSRFSPYYQKIKEVLASGVLGRIVQISVAFDGYARRWDWQTLQENTAGSLYNTGPHPMDQALDLLGGTEVPDILCRMDRVNTYGDAEDYVKIIMTLPGRPLVDVSISSCNAYPGGTYNIQGSHGGLWSSQSQVKWRWFDPKDAPKQMLRREPLTTPEGEPAYCAEKLPWQEEEWVAQPGQDSFNDAVGALYKNLYDQIVSGAPPIVTAEQVRRQIAAIRRCHAQNPLSTLDGGPGNQA